MSQPNRFFTNSLLLTIDAGMAAVLTSGFWLLAARLAPQHEVGIASTVISAASLIALLSRIGFDFAIPYFYPKLEPQSLLVPTLLTASGVCSMILSTIFLLSLKFWLPQLGFLVSSPGWMFGFILLSLSLVLINLFLATGIATERVIWVIAQDAIQNGGRLIFWGLLIYLGGGRTAQALILAFLASALGSVVLGYIKVMPHGSKRTWISFSRPTLSEVRDYALKSYGTSLLATAPGFLLPLLITAKLGPEKTAVFSICWMGLSALVILHSSLVSIIFAEGNRDPRLLYQRFPKVQLATWGLQLGILALAALLGKFALGLFGSSYVPDGYPLLLALTASTLFLASNDFCMVIHRIRNELGIVYQIMGGLAIGTVVLAIFMIPRYGLTGVGFSYLTIQAAVMVLTFFFDPAHPVRLRPAAEQSHS